MERKQVIEAARELNFPRIEVVGAGVVVGAGESTWVSATRDLQPGHLAQIAVELQRLEAESERFAKAAALLDAPAAVAHGAEDERAAAEAREAAESYARHERERAARTEELLARICAAVERSAGLSR